LAVIKELNSLVSLSGRLHLPQDLVGFVVDLLKQMESSTCMICILWRSKLPWEAHRKPKVKLGSLPSILRYSRVEVSLHRLARAKSERNQDRPQRREEILRLLVMRPYQWWSLR
jgi:hypothetical protein